MKTLYRVCITYKLNDDEVPSCSDIIHYGELPKTITETYDFDEAPNRLGFFGTYSMFGNKLKCIHLIDSPFTYVDRKHFNTASVTYEYMSINPNYYSLSKLMDKMPSMEFIEWCNDNGINKV